MSQGFKLRYDQMRESNPAKIDAPSEAGENNGVYHSLGHARNLCLFWPDGRRFFLNYAYLIAGEFIASGDMNKIVLSFSSYSVDLKGYGLHPLYLELLDHLPRIVTVVDPRYVTDDLVESIVIDITVIKLE